MGLPRHTCNNENNEHMARSFSIHYNTSDQERIVFFAKTNKDSELKFFETKEEAGVHSFIDKGESELWYRYAVLTGDGIIMEQHDRHVGKGDGINYFDVWRSPEDKNDVLRAKAFSHAVFPTNDKLFEAPVPLKGTVTISLCDPRIEPNEAFCIVSKQFMNWNTEKAIVMRPYSDFVWQATIHKMPLLKEMEFKFGIWDTENNCFKRFEEGANHIIRIIATDNSHVFAFNNFNYDKLWRAAGVAVPIFSLRTTKSRGCGEFSDIKALADWCEQAKLRVIQLLPINDTTSTRHWRDSYPYNAISTMALHPNYISVQEVYDYYGRRLPGVERETGLYLNDLNFLEYIRTSEWKKRNLRRLFDEEFEKVVSDKKLSDYLAQNKGWLCDYAAFSALRGKYETSDFRQWKELSVYDAKQVAAFFSPNHEMYHEVMFRVFLQYHAEQQMLSAIEYAHSKNIAIKGDLPIGVNPNSVDAWVSPELFNFGLQAGAPPDFFSRDGQNWGFPVYNWDVMSKDNYAWWSRRLGRMQCFFDAFRIDHILGFFRIWGIPRSFTSGLMGVFSPALPFSSEALAERGIMLDPAECALPVVTYDYLQGQLGEMTQSVVDAMFTPKEGTNEFIMKRQFFSHNAVDEWVDDNVPVTIRDRIRSGLANTLHEVLLISVKDGEWHPRIMISETARFHRLSYDQQNAFRALHDDFFYNRHNAFWKEMASTRLGGMLKGCNMLVCGEDLGMIPESVPVVMKRMQILSLELQRMPKLNGERYGDCSKYQYLSVAATSSHDISNIRGWWEENIGETQWYYNNVLHRRGEAPRVAQEDIVSQIVWQHLNSPSMLCINPIQDYAGMLDNMPHLLPCEERINDPSNPNNLWRYRVPFCIDELIERYPELHKRVRTMVENSGR